jgi:ParB-like chromosome segregation protein Spo0J
MAKQGSVKSCVKLIENGTKYPQAPLSSVHIVERPKLGEKKIFFNPRSPESFDVEGMKRLRETIQVDGLQQPLLVRAISKEGGKNIEYLELIAGERRKRCLEWLIQYDAPCYDDDSEPPAEYNVNDWVVFHCQIAKVEKVGTDGSYTVLLNNASCPAEYGDLLPTVPASQLYTNVPCKVVYNCDDRRALRLSVTENGDHQPLTTSEEIDLVERLVVGGFKQEEICEIIDQNVTWVSQTSNFRLQLPPAAFEKLLAGKLARNVAVNILSFAPQDRQTLYDATVSSEEEERKQSVESLQQQ